LGSALLRTTSDDEMIKKKYGFTFEKCFFGGNVLLLHFGAAPPQVYLFWNEKCVKKN
jgi:hypothetical protein